jgi:Na+-translocating ferredoxin:NAD+ oxidoreductase RnfD subunit
MNRAFLLPPLWGGLGWGSFNPSLVGRVGVGLIKYPIMNDQYSITIVAVRSFLTPSLVDELVESGEGWGGALIFNNQ